MCKWCGKIPQLDNMYEDGVSSDIYYNDGTFYTNCGDSYYDMAINYCPNCGKKLETFMVIMGEDECHDSNSHRVRFQKPSLDNWGELADCLKGWT